MRCPTAKAVVLYIIDDIILLLLFAKETRNTIADGVSLPCSYNISAYIIIIIIFGLRLRVVVIVVEPCAWCGRLQHSRRTVFSCNSGSCSVLDGIRRPRRLRSMDDAKEQPHTRPSGGLRVQNYILFQRNTPPQSSTRFLLIDETAADCISTYIIYITTWVHMYNIIAPGDRDQYFLKYNII